MSAAIDYAPETVARAQRAWRCAPFTLLLLQQMLTESVALSAIVGSAGQQNQYTRRLLSELAAERQLLWLIQVGLLRREVDGQGITDRFRLTPLGRYLLEQNTMAGLTAPPRLRERLGNFCQRWLRFF
ncbi:MAG: Npun_F0494 family protein [Cyanobacteria bacterium P01_G01_bin.54]